MAFGHAVMRKGFRDGDMKVKGEKGEVSELLEGGDQDDVIIAFGGDDTIVAGDGEDDVSGGSGNDMIDLGVTADTLTGVYGFSDDVNAEATFDENGTDTVTWYDDEAGENGVYDVIDFSDAIEFVDPSDDGVPLTMEEKVAQVNAVLTYDALTGELGDADGNTWFVVSEDGGADFADTVYVEVDGDQFVYDAALQTWDAVA